MLISVTTTYFSAGLITSNNIVVDSAPILRWSKGKTAKEVKAFFEKKRVLVSWVEMPDPLEVMEKEVDEAEKL